MPLNALTLSVSTGYAGYSFRTKVGGLTPGSDVELRRLSGDGFGYSNGFLRNESLPTPNSSIELVEFLASTGERRSTRFTIVSGRYDLDLAEARAENPAAKSFSPAPIPLADGSQTWGVVAAFAGTRTVVRVAGKPPWVLAAGVWNDNAPWNDAQFWKDSA